MTFLSSLLLVCAGSLGLFFGTANHILHLPYLILLYPFALCAAAHRSPSPFRLGWLIGLPGASAAMYWIAVAVHTYGHFPWTLAVPCSVVLGMFVSLWGGLFAWAMARMRGLSVWRRGAAAVVLWYLLEWTRGWFGTGFPWLTLSSGFAEWPVLLQPLCLVGGYGWSGLLAGAAFLLYEACSGMASGNGRPARSLACLAVAAFILAGGAAFGVWRLATYPARMAAEGTPLTIAMVQGNVPQDVKWSSAFRKATRDRYMELTMDAVRRSVEALKQGGAASPMPDAQAFAASAGLRIGSANDAVLAPSLPDLLLWPETAMPFAYPSSTHAQPLRSFVRELGIPLVFGALGVERKGSGKTLFNRAFLLGEEGDGGSYDKEHLVPFGEYLPPVLDWKVFEPLLQGLGGFEAGGDDPPFVIPLQGRPSVRAGMLVCYEAIFPELARQRVADGADILLNISNDAWYDYTSAPMQHLQLSLMRSVEQGRWTARATNSGVTAFLDPLGGVHAMGSREDGFALFKSGSLTGTVLAMDGHTPYFYLHPWLPPMAMLLAAALFLPSIRRARRKK